MSDESTITKKGQITIPSKFRNEYNLKAGKKVNFIKTPEGILIKPVVEDVRSLRGIIKAEIGVNELQHAIDELRKEWSLQDE
jgi:AbrB family looped-hinge helix DNA binding protein